MKLTRFSDARLEEPEQLALDGGQRVTYPVALPGGIHGRGDEEAATGEGAISDVIQEEVGEPQEPITTGRCLERWLDEVPLVHLGRHRDGGQLELLL